MPVILIKTFGCKVNYAESVAALEQLSASGAAAAEYSRSALATLQDAPSAVVVNSCCVTAEAERKALQFVRGVRRRWPETAVLLTGCNARHPLIRERYKEAGALVLGEFAHVLAWLKAHINAGTDREPLTLNAPIRSRAFIKVQDGCSCNCSYCIIPAVRSYSSQRIENVITEVDRQLGRGCRELVLTGVNLGHYGRALDSAHPRLPELVERVLARLPAYARLRLSSIEPEDVSAELLAHFRHPQLCPHLHIPLQSGSDRVLSAMNRRYTAAEYLAVVKRFRRACPHGAITTDVMAGFPTETEADFAATLAVCERAGFERAHCFPFSPRPGTAAAKLPGLPTSRIQQRNRRLIGHCAAIAHARWLRFVGSATDVLVEKPYRDRSIGHGPAYQVVEVLGETDPALRGRIVPVKLVSYEEGRFAGRIVSADKDQDRAGIQ